MKLIVIRHGQTVWNEENRIQSHRHNSPFTKLGERQNERMVRAIEKEHVSVVYTSCLKRCIGTIDLILERKPNVLMILEPRLSQRNWAALEGMTRGEIGKKYPESGYDENGRTVDKEKKYIFRPPGGGETWSDVTVRIHNFLSDILQKHDRDETVALVTHSAISRVILSELTGAHLWTIHPEIKRTTLNMFRVQKNENGTFLIINIPLMLRYRYRLYHTFTP